MSLVKCDYEDKKRICNEFHSYPFWTMCSWTRFLRWVAWKHVSSSHAIFRAFVLVSSRRHNSVSAWTRRLKTFGEIISSKIYVEKLANTIFAPLNIELLKSSHNNRAKRNSLFLISIATRIISSIIISI